MGRIFQIGNTWYIDTCYKGKRVRKAVGRDRKLAESILKKVEVQLIENRYLEIKKEERTKFSELTKLFLGTYSKINKRSWKKDKVIINHLNKVFGHKCLYEINSKDIEEYKKMRISENVKLSTINRELACLRTILNKAKEWGLLHSAIPRIVLFKVDNQRIRYLTEPEAEKLIELSPEPLKSIIILALNTGMRRGEIISLKWDNINFKDKMITLIDTKNKEKRIVWINNIVLETLSRIPRKTTSPFVFVGKDGINHISEHYISHLFEKMVKKAKIKDFKFHDLRHTFASWLVMRGVNLKTVQELLGHKSFNMTLRYSHLAPEVKKQAVELLEKSHVYGKNMAKGKITKNSEVSQVLN